MLSTWRYPVPSFVSPITPPTVDPDNSGSLVSIHVASEWLPYIVGALHQLVQQSTWLGTTDEQYLAIQRSYDLMAMVGNAMPGILDVRQNTVNPSILEKTFDNATWVAWANIAQYVSNMRIHNGVLQQWDGSMWNDVPLSGDERFSGTFTPAWPTGSVPSGQTAQCLAATNSLSIYTSTLTEVQAVFDASGLISEAGGTALQIIGLFMPVSWIPGALLDVIAGLFAGGSSLITDCLTTATKNIILCSLDMHSESDGSYTSADFTAILSDMSSISNSTTRSIVVAILNLLGPVGLSRTSQNGITVGDCSVCVSSWCFEIDLTASDGGFVPNGGNSQWISGTGWQPKTPNFGNNEIQLTLDASTVLTHVEYDESNINTTCTRGVCEAYIETTNGNLVIDTGLGMSPGGTLTWSGSHTGATLLYIGVLTDATFVGMSTITRVKVSGTGPNPTGINNC